MNFKPFENDTQSITLGPDNGLTFENEYQSITVYGDFRIDKDTDIKDINSIIEILESIKNKLETKDKLNFKK